MIVEGLRKISDLLCKWKPKNRLDFIKRMHKAKENLFKSQLPISIFILKNGVLKHDI